MFENKQEEMAILEEMKSELLRQFRAAKGPSIPENNVIAAESANVYARLLEMQLRLTGQ